jgi:hypothetical protein
MTVVTSVDLAILFDAFQLATPQQRIVRGPIKLIAADRKQNGWLKLANQKKWDANRTDKRQVEITPKPVSR